MPSDIDRRPKGVVAGWECIISYLVIGKRNLAADTVLATRALTAIPGSAILVLPHYEKASGFRFRGPFSFACWFL